MDREEDSDHYEDHYTDNTSTSNEEMDDHVELDTDNSSSSMDMVEHHSEYDYDDLVHHHSEYDYDELAHHHSEYDYDDTMYHYIKQGDHMDGKHTKDYHDYMSCDDDSTMLKSLTLEDGQTYFGSSSPSFRHHGDHHRQALHVAPHRQALHAHHLRHSSSTSE